MLFPTHFVGGALAALYFTPVAASPETILLAAAVGAVAASLPDIDSAESFLGSRMWVVSAAVQTTVGHRGPLHSLITAAVIYLLANWLTYWPAELPLWLLCGYTSHLFLDALNPAGVLFFWPLPFRVKLPLVKTAGILEAMIIFPAITIAYLYLFCEKMGVFGFV